MLTPSDKIGKVDCTIEYDFQTSDKIDLWLVHTPEETEDILSYGYSVR